MRIFEIESWPNYLRWVLFFPISILAAVLLYLIIYLVIPMRFSDTFAIFVYTSLVQSICLFVAMLIIPKGKKIIGYVYVVFFVSILIITIIMYFDGNIESPYCKVESIISRILGVGLSIWVVKNYEKWDFI